jgi:hypothetical protein
LVEGLQRIKSLSRVAGADTNGAFLGVHPGLKKELATAGRTVSDEISRYLKCFLSPEKLSLVAFMGIPSDTFAPWIFFQGPVRRDANGVAAFVHAPLSGFGAATKMSETLPGLRFVATFDDVPERPLSLAKLFAQKNAPNGRANALLGDFDIENPELTHALNMDCASCHATHALKTGAGQASSIHQLSDISPTRFIPKRGVTAYITSEAFNLFDWHVHNLGYLGVAPKVSERTLNETGAVVDVVNRLIAGDEHENPGFDCGSDRAMLDPIYFCQFSTPLTAGDRQACFSGCKVVGAVAPH